MEVLLRHQKEKKTVDNLRLTQYNGCVSLFEIFFIWQFVVCECCQFPICLFFDLSYVNHKHIKKLAIN